MNKKIKIRYGGQSLLEYSIMLIVIVAALLATSLYVKRSIQGRWKSTVDDFGDQYDPRTANGMVTHSMNSYSDTVISIVSETGGSWTQRRDFTNSTETRVGNTTVK